MNLAYVCADTGIPFLGGKGASVHMREMTRTLGLRGHDVTVACASIGEGNPPPGGNLIALEPEGDEQAVQMKSAFRRGKIDVVLERYSLRSGAARTACDVLGIPLVLEVNAPIVLEAARYRGLNNVEDALAREREIFARADGAAVVSSALEAYVAARAPNLRIRRIPNGVDLARFASVAKMNLGLPAGAVSIGYVGGMRPWHGLLDLIEAFALVARERSNAYLVVAGKGQHDAAVRSRARRHGLGGRVVFLGGLPHDEVPGVLAAVDVGVAPYRASDDFYFSSMKVLEYMASGLPVVYPEIGDLPATVGPGGVPYPPGDTGALAAAMTRLVRDAELRRTLGGRGRLRAESFTWDSVASQIEVLIELCCAAAPQAAAR